MLKFNILLYLLLISFTIPVWAQPDTFHVIRYDPVQVEKTYNVPTFAHYMPWFETPEFSGEGRWNHWNLNADPDTFNEGKRDVGSHYTPLVDAYDSRDPYMAEYAALSMKLTGLDGVIIAYFGNSDILDYGKINDGTHVIIDAIQRVGLSYFLLYGDDNAVTVANLDGRGLSPAEILDEHISYMSDQFFAQNNYVKYDDNPVLLMWGSPNTGVQSWKDMVNKYQLSVASFIGIYEENDFTDSFKGIYSWTEQGRGYEYLEDFYMTCTSLDLCGGAAAPGYWDYYDEPLGFIDDNGGETFKEILDFNNTLDGLLTTEDLLPRSVWWVYRVYADLLNERFEVSFADPNFTGIAGSTVDGAVRILLGTYTLEENFDTIKTELNIPDLSQQLNLTVSDSLTVTGYLIPNTEFNALVTPEKLFTKSTIGLEIGSIEVYIPANAVIVIDIMEKKDQTTSIFEEYKSVSTVNIYPNPSQDLIHIEGESLMDATLEILTSDGKLLARRESQNHKETIDISSYPPGIIVVKIANSKTGLSIVRRIVKTN